MNSTAQLLKAALHEQGMTTTTFEVYDVYNDEETVFTSYSPEDFLEKLEKHALSSFDEYMDDETDSLEDLMYSVLQDLYIKITPCDDRNLARVFAEELKDGALNERLDEYLESKAENEFGYAEEEDERRTDLAHMRGEILVLQMANERLEKEIEELKKAVKPQAKRKSK